jgi:hypothetical protein
MVAEHDGAGGHENGAEPTVDSSASQGEILRLIHEIRAFSADIRAKTGKNTPE